MKLMIQFLLGRISTIIKKITNCALLDDILLLVFGKNVVRNSCIAEAVRVKTDTDSETVSEKGTI